MKTSMREMQRRKAAKASRVAGTPAGTRNPKLISPYQQRAKSKVWHDDREVEPELVVRAEDLAALAKMSAAPHDKFDFADDLQADAYARRNGMRPLKPPPVVIPERNDAARVAARRDRNGIA
jgi:hypothetical protein